MSAWYTANLTLIQGSLIAFLLAMSVQVGMRIGVLSVAGVGFYGFGEYVAAILTTRHATDPVVAFLAAVVASAAGGVVVALVVRRVQGLYLAVVTLAFTLILGVVATNGGSLTGGANGIFGINEYVGTIPMAVVCVVVITGAVVTQRGMIGRACEVLRTDRLLGASLGVNAGRYTQVSFALGGALGGAAGALNALSFGSVAPTDASFTLIVSVLTMVVIGGRRSWVGAFIGAVLITWLPSELAFLSGSWRDVAFGGLVVATATLSPDGLTGIGSWMLRRMRVWRHGGRKDDVSLAVDGGADGT